MVKSDAKAAVLVVSLFLVYTMLACLPIPNSFGGGVSSTPFRTWQDSAALSFIAVSAQVVVEVWFFRSSIPQTHLHRFPSQAVFPGAPQLLGSSYLKFGRSARSAGILPTEYLKRALTCSVRVCVGVSVPATRK